MKMYATFARHIIYPTTQFFIRRNVLKHLQELEQTQWLPKNDIEKLQWRKLKRILERAYTNVSYYNHVFKKLNIRPKDIIHTSDLRKLPFLEKETITNNINNIISSKYEKKDLIRDSTGGSTGVNLQFYYDNKSIDYRQAVEFRNDQWAGLYLGDKYVKLWGSHIDISFNKTFKGKMYNLLFRQLILSSYNLSEKSMNEYARRILQYKPKCIIGYSSSLYIFAKFLNENRIEGIKPQSVISSAEVLHNYQLELIESVFECKVFNRYGCREFGTIAQECEKHKGLHINAEHVYVELLDKNGNSCKPGEIGEIVVTDLDNYSFPFIRYKIADLGILSDNLCDCGRKLPLLEKVEGRVFDIIVGTNGNHLTGTFWTILLRTYVQGIEQFQVIQENFGELIVKLVVNRLFTKKEKQKLLKRIFEKCGKDMKVDIQLMDEIPLTGSGKHRFVISKVSPFVD